jgi:thiol-disulfide isomerase/thioredoxin
MLIERGFNEKIFTNLVLFTALSVAFSNLTACTKTATQSGSTETSKNAQNSNYPPVPSGIIQADIKDLDGNTFKLEDKKGKVVLVDLWATWCGPCREAMPDLIELQDKYRDKNFEVLGLNTDDETPEAVRAFAQTKKLNYPLGYADGKLMSEFIRVTRLQGIPQSILINRDGRMVGIFPGGGSKVMAQIKETVDQTVNEQQN